MHYPTSIHLSRETQNMTSHLIRQVFLLSLVSMLEELLDDVVPEDISHQLDGIGGKLSKDLIFFIAIRRLEFLLDEAGPMLITTEFDNMTIDILELCQQVQTQAPFISLTFSSYLLFVLLLFLKSSNKGLRVACIIS